MVEKYQEVDVMWRTWKVNVSVRGKSESESENWWWVRVHSINCVNIEHWTDVYFNTRPRIYRLMIENAVIKLKDRNGSAEGEIKITTIFILYTLLLLLLLFVQYFFFRCKIKLCPALCTLFVRNIIELLSLFLCTCLHFFQICLIIYLSERPAYSFSHSLSLSYSISAVGGCFCIECWAHPKKIPWDTNFNA